MKEAIVHPGPKVEIVDAPVPTPGQDQIVIKVVVSGSNPKDWKVPQWLNTSQNQGDDIAGIVSAVGDGVTEFKKGDRVAAFHEMMTPGGSYAEYALAWAHTTFHIPASTTFEQAAAIPLAAMTSAVGLYVRLGLPAPWTPPKEEIPLVIYGAASAVGIYAVQLALKSGIHPIIAVAGRAKEYVSGFLDASKGDVVIDYRGGDDAVVQGMKDALKGRKLYFALDAVSDKGSYANIAKVLEPKGGKITLVLPGKEYEGIPETVEKTMTNVGSVHQDQKDFGFLFFRYFGRGLKEGWFKPQQQEVVPGGLAGIEGALKKLKSGEASAVKYVFRIADTPGVKTQSSL